MSRLVKQPLWLILLLLVSSTSARFGCCTSQHFSSFCRMYVSVYEISDNSSESKIYLEKNNVWLVEASQVNHQYCINISRASLISDHSTCRSQMFEAFIEVFLTSIWMLALKVLIPYCRLDWIHSSLGCCLAMSRTVIGLADPDVVWCTCLLHLYREKTYSEAPHLIVMIEQKFLALL